MSENTSGRDEQKSANRGGNNKNKGNYRNNNNNYNGKRRSGKNYSGKRNYNNDRDRKGGEDRKKQRPNPEEERTIAESSQSQSQPREQRHGKFDKPEGGFKKKREKNFNPAPKKKARHEETVDDIRADNARITKEIYLEISSIKDIKLD